MAKKQETFQRKPNVTYTSRTGNEPTETTKSPLDLISDMFKNDDVKGIMVKYFQFTGANIQILALDNNKLPLMKNGSPVIFSALGLYKPVLDAFHNNASIRNIKETDICFTINKSLLVRLLIKGQPDLNFGEKTINNWLS
jgi:hypothetical protein